jgi:hypothetical protein
MHQIGVIREFDWEEVTDPSQHSPGKEFMTAVEVDKLILS